MIWLAWSRSYSVDSDDRLVLHTSDDAESFRESGWNVEGPFVLETEKSDKINDKERNV